MGGLSTDRALLDRFRAGDPEALRTVYWEYVRKVERLLGAGFDLRGGEGRVKGVGRQPHDLADLVQDVFLRAFSEQGRRGYDGLRDYAPYLYTIARNVLVDWWRARGREAPAPWSELSQALDTAPPKEPPAPWDNPITMSVVEDYLASLTEPLRTLHRLRHQETLSQEETARRMGVSRQTLRTLEQRLRAGLAAALEQAGIHPDCQPNLPAPRSDPRKGSRNENAVE
jgi:RNA polymerase sigma factor (sigma-70 family)